MGTRETRARLNWEGERTKHAPRRIKKRTRPYFLDISSSKKARQTKKGRKKEAPTKEALYSQHFLKRKKAKSLRGRFQVAGRIRCREPRGKESGGKNRDFGTKETLVRDHRKSSRER